MGYLWTVDNLQALAAESDQDFRVYRTAGDAISQNVWELLSQHSQYRLDRYLIAGSIGKRTHLGVKYEPDFDLVIFVNDIRPPFDDVIENFARILKLNRRQCSNWQSLRVTREGRKSLQFTVTTQLVGSVISLEIDFDLSIGINMIKAKNCIYVTKCQVKNTLRHIYGLADPEEDHQLYSASLAERTVSIVRGQPLFVHKVIKLAKLWAAETGITGHGQSYIFELMAMKASVKTKGKLARAFRRFLNMVIDYQNLAVYFPQYCNANHYLHPHFQRKVNHARPLVLDPANPYNNLAENVQESNWYNFAQHAQHVLRMLDRKSHY